MTKQEKTHLQKVEKLNSLLMERVKYLEARLKYEDPVSKCNPPPKHIPM